MAKKKPEPIEVPEETTEEVEQPTEQVQEPVPPKKYFVPDLGTTVEL